MALEEMKKELEKNGYSVTKKHTNQKFFPCICGYNRRKHLNHYGYIACCCNRCGLIAPASTSHEGAKANWNRMITAINAGEPWNKVYLS